MHLYLYNYNSTLKLLCQQNIGIKRIFKEKLKIEVIYLNKKVPNKKDILKFEIAKELGLDEKILNEGWKSLTSKESGKIGGMLHKRLKEIDKK